MGKVYKRKRRACALCKPHKRGWVKRRKTKEAGRIKALDQQIRHIGE